MPKKPPRIASSILRWVLPLKDRDYLLGDYEESFQKKYQEKGSFSASRWYWRQLIYTAPDYLFESFYWRLVMTKNHLKIALRYIKRHKSYSFINIMGLAIGIACCLFILIYIQFELSYDTYHNDKDRIFRIAREFNSSQWGQNSYAATPGLLASIIKENYPEVEQVVRIRKSYPLVTYKEKSFFEDNIHYADQTIFNVFSIPLIVGDPATALERPYTVIITENIAGKYFGGTDPAGKLLNIDGYDYTITAIAKNPPQNSILKYSIVGAMKTIADEDVMANWLSSPCHTFIKLKEKVKPDDFENKISHLSQSLYGDELRKSGSVATFFLQPLSRIHLHSHLQNELEPSGNPLYLYILSIIGMLILIVACINFINLTTARATKREKEIGIRKVIGAGRGKLIQQFLVESCLISLLAASLAFFIVCSSLGYFSNLSGIEFSLTHLFSPLMILIFTLLILFTCIAAGSYPALFLSVQRPAKVLKGMNNPGSRRSIVRRTLVLGQFAISIILIIGSLFIFKQIYYLKNMNPGFNKEQKLIIPIKERARDREFFRKNYETVKNEFLRHPSISGATAIYYPPGIWTRAWQETFERGENALLIQMLPVDFDFIREYSIKITAGRNFQREIATDTKNAIILNTTAVKALGFNDSEEAVNKVIKRSEIDTHAHDSEMANEFNIIGVTDDFHFYNFKSKILPVLLVLNAELFSNISLTINSQNLAETISFAEKKWKELFPGRPFEYYFLEERINEQFRMEEQTGKIFGTFTLISIFIACLGLFGLASFIVEQRTKEIGIRKIFGSSSVGVAALLTKDFIKWVLFANVIAWPAAFFATKTWLQNFPYRIKIGISVFIISSVSALLIAMLTVGYQTIKSAKANPADSLRYE